MDVMQAIKDRRSVRAYSDRPVAESDLEQILEAARLAPSASNRQAWKFIVVTDAGVRQQLCEASRNQAFVAQAPVVIAAVALEPERLMPCGVAAAPVDLSIAVDHMTLVAVALDLGTCWIGAFDQERAREILAVPAELQIVALLPLGYPADEPRPKSRKQLDEIVAYQRWEG